MKKESNTKPDSLKRPNPPPAPPEINSTEKVNFIDDSVSVQLSEKSADALYKLLNSLSINKMQELGLDYDEACLVSKVKPCLY